MRQPVDQTAAPIHALIGQQQIHINTCGKTSAIWLSLASFEALQVLRKSYRISITPLGIEGGIRGDIIWKADAFSLQGPASLQQILPVLPVLPDTRSQPDDDIAFSV